MGNRLRTGWLAGSSALLLVLALSGGVMGATLATDTEPVPEVVEPVDTTETFEDLDGNGVDDDCDEAVVANPEAVAAAFAGLRTPRPERHRPRHVLDRVAGLGWSRD